MAVFWRLVLAHFIADFTFQTNWMAKLKRKRVLGMVLHSMMHPLVTILLTYPYLDEHWVDTGPARLNGWVCVTFIFLTHFLQDSWRVYTIQRFHTSDSTLHFLWDQLVHFGVLFAMFPFLLLGGEFKVWFPEVWVGLGILFVVVSHFTTVLIYFMEKDLWGGGYPGDDEKYLTITERVGLALCFLLPGGWFLPAAAAWAAAGWQVRRSGILEYSWFGYAVGTALAVFCGIGARLLLL